MEAQTATGDGRGGRRPGSGRKPRSDSLSLDVRTRLAVAKAKKEEGLARKVALEVKAREGTLIDEKASREASRRAVMMGRDAMLSIPGRVAAQLANMDDEREIERFLTAEIRAELTRVADAALADAV